MEPKDRGSTPDYAMQRVSSVVFAVPVNNPSPLLRLERKGEDARERKTNPAIFFFLWNVRAYPYLQVGELVTVRITDAKRVAKQVSCDRDYGRDKNRGTRGSPTGIYDVS